MPGNKIILFLTITIGWKSLNEFSSTLLLIKRKRLQVNYPLSLIHIWERERERERESDLYFLLPAMAKRCHYWEEGRSYLDTCVEYGLIHDKLWWFITICKPLVHAEQTRHLQRHCRHDIAVISFFTQNLIHVLLFCFVECPNTPKHNFQLDVISKVSVWRTIHDFHVLRCTFKIIFDMKYFHRN